MLCRARRRDTARGRVVTVRVHGRGQTIDVAGIGRLYHEVEGEGPPVLLVGGGPGVDHAHYHPWFSRLAQGRRVIYYDHPGTGRSVPAAEDAFTVEAYSSAIEALRGHLGIDSLALVGLSFGGIPAVEFAQQHPGRVAALVLSNAHVDARGWQEGNIDHVNLTLREHYPETWAELAAMRSAGVDSADERYQELLGIALPGLEWAEPWTRPTLNQPDTPPSWRAYEAFVGADPEWKVTGSLAGYAPRLEDIDVPTLVLAGRHDGLTLPRLAFEQAQRLPRATLHVFERSGHRPWCEEPDAYAEVVEGFLTSLPRDHLTTATDAGGAQRDPRQAYEWSSQERRR
jgi:proline iminopeptidase